MKKSMLAMLILFLMTSVAFSQMSDLKNTLMEKEKEMYEAVKAGDWDTFQANLADNFVGVYAEGISNRSEELKQIKKVKIDSYEISDFQVTQPVDGVALVVYKMQGSGSYGGQQFSGKYHCASTWKESNGEWQAVMHTEIEAKEMGSSGQDMEEDSDY